VNTADDDALLGFALLLILVALMLAVWR